PWGRGRKSRHSDRDGVRASLPGLHLPDDLRSGARGRLSGAVLAHVRQEASPRLHVIFLDRESPDGVSQEDGDWVAERDPLVTVTTGYRLTATLRANSRITNTVVVPPDYRCMPHTFVFSGDAGGPGEAGEAGPDATGRLA